MESIEKARIVEAELREREITFDEGGRPIRMSPTEVKKSVPPNGTLKGFLIEMPARVNESKAPTSGAKPTKPLDLTRAPYRVWFLDRSCSWGVVEPGTAEHSGNG